MLVLGGLFRYVGPPLTKGRVCLRSPYAPYWSALSSFFNLKNRPTTTASGSSGSSFSKWASMAAMRSDLVTSGLSCGFRCSLNLYWYLRRVPMVSLSKFNFIINNKWSPLWLKSSSRISWTQFSLTSMLSNWRCLCFQETSPWRTLSLGPKSSTPSQSKSIPH